MSTLSWEVTALPHVSGAAHKTWGNRILSNHRIEGMAAADGP